MREKLLKIDKGVEKVAYWAAFLLLLASASSWLARRAELYGIDTWEEAVLSGLVISVVLSVLAALGFTGVTLARTIWYRRDHLSRSGASHTLADKEIIERFEKVEGAIRALGERLETLPEWLTKQSNITHDYLLSTHDAAIEAQKRIAHISKGLEQEGKARTELAAWVRAQLLVSQVLRKLEKMVVDIDQRSARLTEAVKADENYDWVSWRQDYKRWENEVSEFIRLIELAMPGTELRDVLFFVDPESYKTNKWEIDFSKFPDADIVQDYKTFHIRRGRFDQAAMNAALHVRRIAWLKIEPGSLQPPEDAPP